MHSLDSTLPIGLFDSGVGGLTVLSALKKRLPDENYLYLGDTARVPYGTKTCDTVVRYSLEAAQELVNRGIKMLVIACNTATTSLPDLQKAFPGLPVIGVVQPGAAAAVAASAARNIVVLATESTITNRAYHNAIEALAPGARVTGIPCSLLVALAEEGWAGERADDPVTGRSIAESVVARYLSSAYPEVPGGPAASAAIGDRPDCIILGCTHFPPFGPAVQRLAGDKVAIVDPAVTTAEVMADTLARGNLLNTPPGRQGNIRLLATDAPARFARVGSLFLGQPIAQEDVEIVCLPPTGM